MDPELAKARNFMHKQIFEFMVRQPPPKEISQKRILDIAKCLEKGLFRTSTSQEEYMNLDTLESRLHAIIKQAQMNRNNPQRSQCVNSSAPLDTIMSTPEMPQHGNSNLISSAVDNSAVSAGTCDNMSSSA